MLWLPTVVVLLVLAWGVAALHYRLPGGAIGKAATITAWVLIGIVTLYLLWTHRPLGVAGFAMAFLLLLLWWQRIRPSNDRPWSDDVACMTRGEIRGDEAVLHNVRNFEWRTREDYTQRWETRRYDLRRLGSVDLVTSYWTIPAIAHVLVSFGFDDGQYVVFSVEVRRRKHESYSELAGFFRKFELSVIAADERDIIAVRTNVRGEDDYLYRVRMPPGARRALFEAYVSEANSLLVRPRFYNTVTANCTTLLYHMMRQIVGHLPLHYKLVLSGYLPEYVYQVGGLDTRLPFEELRRLGRITDRARAAPADRTFSAAIRTGIPPVA